MAPDDLLHQAPRWLERLHWLITEGLKVLMTAASHANGANGAPLPPVPDEAPSAVPSASAAEAWGRGAPKGAERRAERWLSSTVKLIHPTLRLELTGLYAARLLSMLLAAPRVVGLEEVRSPRVPLMAMRSPTSPLMAMDGR
jgi:hypothetical protein